MKRVGDDRDMSSNRHAALTLRLADDAEVSDWLDALAAEECTPDEFIDAVLRRERDNADIGWETLALLDQQFRRQKISHEVFITVKARLQQHLLPAEPAPQPQPQRPEAPIVATRAVAIVDMPVITTAVEPPPPTGPVDTTFHGELEAGDRLCNRYRVVDILRRNSSSTVVEAIDEMKFELPGARRRLAIQVVDETLSRDPEFLARISKVQGLAHPGIARLFDVDEDNGALVLIKELLNGPSLHDLLARNEGKLLHDSFAQAAVGSIASALAYAHSQGVTHGNVSTRNIFINQAGDIRLQGFEDTFKPVEPAADRLAFAWLAYELLTGAQAEQAKPGYGSRLRPPPGLARNKWRALRDTLKGKSNRSNVLTELAGNAAGETRRWPWVAAALLAAGLGIAAWLLLDKVETSPPTAAAIAATLPSAAAAPDIVADSAVTPARNDPAPRADAALRTEPVPRADAAPRPIAPATPPAVAPARSRIELQAATATVESTARVARIWVSRRDNLNGAVTFQWWTETGSAEEDRHFRRIFPRTETIPSGANGIELLVPLIPDAERRETRTFYVKIDAPSPRATLGSKTLMQVSIVPIGT
jgi:hypothetical protein